MAAFAAILDNERLASELKRLQEALVTADENWRGDTLLVALQSARQKINNQKTDPSKNHLVPLNP